MQDLLTGNKAKVINDIINTIMQLHLIDKLEDNSDGEIHVYYPLSGQGSVIAQQIDDMMMDKYPHQDFNIKIIHSDLHLVVTLI